MEKNNKRIELSDERLFESFNVEIKKNVVSVNIYTEELLKIEGLVNNKNDFVERLEFVLSKSAELIPSLILNAMNDSIIKSENNDDIKKIQIANELLKNTTNIPLQDFIKHYIMIERNDIMNEYEDEKDILRLDKCIEYIVESEFDITGWGLNEIPVYYDYVFFNKEKKKAFDLIIYNLNDRVIPSYIDRNYNDQDATTIQEAIEKYLSA